MARDYKIQGTTSFLNWAAGFFLLLCWFVKDGWFPRDSVREKHGDPPASAYNIFASSPNPSAGESGSYYPFNRIGAVVWCFSSVVCLYIHFVVK